jgi:hypothetical protein
VTSSRMAIAVPLAFLGKKTVRCFGASGFARLLPGHLLSNFQSPHRF